MADRLESRFDFYFARATNTLLHKQANFGGENGLTRTCKVGSYEANRLGLFDLHGNVLEWCLDTVDAADGSWAYRGGGWANANAPECQAAIRNPYPAPVRSWNLGLRVARVPAATPTPEPKTPPLAAKPFTDADIKRIAALPAAEQVEAVRKELMRRNPKFDGVVEPTFEKDAVISLKLSTLHVMDISPVRALTGLRTLESGNSSRDRGVLADLSPLKGMALERLNCAGTRVSDLSPLKGMKLKVLLAMNTDVSDLTPLQGMPLKHLDLHGARKVTNLQPLEGMPLEYLNLSYLSVRDLSLLADMTSLRQVVLSGMPVSDLTPLQGLRLRELAINKSQVSDLSALKGMALVSIRLTPRNITRGLNILRDMTSLKTVAVGEANTKIFPAAEFWARHDKGEFEK
jgi:hypothetical protein